MHAPLLAACALVLPLLARPAPQEDVGARYRELAEAGDRAGLVALWRENPFAILVTIDADLEGSLRLRESAPDAPDEKAIAGLLARALLGADTASEATGHPIFADYASSFAGWDGEQQRRFRQGQQAFGRAGAALEAGDHEAALAAASECVQLAEPLGDWWGTAMGLSVQGRALLQLQRPEEALVALSRGRLVHHDLRLLGSEYDNLLGIVEALSVLGRDGRTLVAAQQALALGRQLGDGNVERLQEMVDELSTRLGRG